MAELRRVRQIELARIAWRDLAGAGRSRRDARRALAARGWPDRRRPRAYAVTAAREAPRVGRATPRARRCRCSCSRWASSAAASSISRPTSISCFFTRMPRPAASRTTRRQPLTASAETYYLRLAQLLIKLLDQATADGFVYRVDARLRPFGASGPLVVSVVGVRVVPRAARARLGALRVRQGAAITGARCSSATSST